MDRRNRYKKHKWFLYVSCIYNAFWWVGIVTEVNVHESDLKIEFLHPHGPRKTFSRPSVDDKCFALTSNILKQSPRENVSDFRH